MSLATTPGLEHLVTLIETDSPLLIWGAFEDHDGGGCIYTWLGRYHPQTQHSKEPGPDFLRSSACRKSRTSYATGTRTRCGSAPNSSGRCGSNSSTGRGCQLDGIQELLDSPTGRMIGLACGMLWLASIAYYTFAPGLIERIDKWRAEWLLANPPRRTRAMPGIFILMSHGTRHRA